MKSAYLAICYICNEKCKFCPCSTQEKSAGIITDITEIRHTVDSMFRDGVTEVTVSGGEPTLHPDFFEIVQYIQNKGMRLTILTNSERFSEDDFFNDFWSIVNKDTIKIITTLHSERVDVHEEANQTRGSFDRTVKGLLKLSENGFRVIIKHCITKQNYKDLASFYMFCEGRFLECVDIQLCSIDYCGISEEKLRKEMLPFPKQRPYLEEMFDLHIARKQTGGKRKLYCINMPLCSCDVFYWKDYIQDCRGKMYDEYKDPHKNDTIRISNNVGVDMKLCQNCKVASICSGTYYSAFRFFGAKIVKPFL